MQSFTKQCRISASGSVVTNLTSPLSFFRLPNGCTTALDMTDVPTTFAGVEIMGVGAGVAGPDTPFPLSFQQALPLTAAPAGSPSRPPAGVINVAVRGTAFTVTVWVGPDATEQDKAAIERIVASIRTNADGSQSQTEPACPAKLAEPAIIDGHACVPEAPAGNGPGPDGACTGREPSPPCGPGAEIGRY